MGVLGNVLESVTLVNRTNRVLTVRYDGEEMKLKPGRTKNFPRVAVAYAQKQNPLMGSQHPYDPTQYISLIGVEVDEDASQVLKDWVQAQRVGDCSPISEEILHVADGKYERVDRSGEFHGEPMAKVKLLRKSGFTAYEAAVAMPDTFDVNKNIS
jgi:hypothetical protein